MKMMERSIPLIERWAMEEAPIRILSEGDEEQMSYAIVYSSKTGNTRMLADALRGVLPEEDCLYFGPPDAAALEADRLYIGFWTDKGTCDGATAAFFDQLDSQEVFLFGTCGFGGSEVYFRQLLERVQSRLPETAEVIGQYMCVGRMPQSVRERYLRIAEEEPAKRSQMQKMILNFDSALSHPDEADLQGLIEAVKAL